MKKYLVKVDQEEFVVQIRLLEDDLAETTAKSELKEEKQQSAPTSVGEKIEAPLGGTILQINVQVGQSVAAGDTLMILEALKLENEISATFAGRVTQILTSVGETVETGENLMVLEKE